jgi:predicted alpha/beta hydrolase family esterase
VTDPTVVVVHGTKGSPDGNWFPWLADELAARGVETVVPQFPTPEGQTLDGWLAAFDDLPVAADESTVFVAHSVGPAFVCALLERPGAAARACYFVAGFTGLLGHDEFDPLNESITDRDVDFAAVRDACPRFRCYHGTDDPYVSTNRAAAFAANLGVEPTWVTGGGHLNEPSGYTAFPRLLADLRADLGLDR